MNNLDIIKEFANTNKDAYIISTEFTLEELNKMGIQFNNPERKTFVHISSENVVNNEKFTKLFYGKFKNHTIELVD